MVIKYSNGPFWKWNTRNNCKGCIRIDSLSMEKYPHHNCFLRSHFRLGSLALWPWESCQQASNIKGHQGRTASNKEIVDDDLRNVTSLKDVNCLVSLQRTFRKYQTSVKAKPWLSGGLLFGALRFHLPSDPAVGSVLLRTLRVPHYETILRSHPLTEGWERSATASSPHTALTRLRSHPTVPSIH